MLKHKRNSKIICAVVTSLIISLCVGPLPNLWAGEGSQLSKLVESDQDLIQHDVAVLPDQPLKSAPKTTQCEYLEGFGGCGPLTLTKMDGKSGPQPSIRDRKDTNVIRDKQGNIIAYIDSEGNTLRLIRGPDGEVSEITKTLRDGKVIRIKFNWAEKTAVVTEDIGEDQERITYYTNVRRQGGSGTTPVNIRIGEETLASWDGNGTWHMWFKYSGMRGLSATQLKPPLIDETSPKLAQDPGPRKINDQDNTEGGSRGGGDSEAELAKRQYRELFPDHEASGYIGIGFVKVNNWYKMAMFYNQTTGHAMAIFKPLDSAINFDQYARPTMRVLGGEDSKFQWMDGVELTSFRLQKQSDGLWRAEFYLAALHTSKPYIRPVMNVQDPLGRTGAGATKNQLVGPVLTMPRRSGRTNNAIPGSRSGSITSTVEIVKSEGRSEGNPAITAPPAPRGFVPSGSSIIPSPERSQTAHQEREKRRKQARLWNLI